MNDELCIDMAKTTYEGMKHGGTTDESVCRGLYSAIRKLRDRWLDMLTRQADKTLITTAPAPNINKDQKDGRLPRDASESDEDDEETRLLHRIPLRWVPYVHFGV